MTIHLLRDKGVPLERQRFTWRDIVRQPYSKLDNDAFTRVRVILMNGIESQAVRFSHSFARMSREMQWELARVRRIEHHQQTLVNWLNPPDQSVLETTLGYEQTAIEVTAAAAECEPDPYLAQVYRFGMLEDFDHLYRFSALMDRVEGKDANTMIQSYTDLVPGRPTSLQHRHPDDEIRRHYQRDRTQLLSKLNAITILSAEHQVRDYYMNVGPVFSDPVARMLYAEIVSIEEQHVTHYESTIDPEETLMEKWLLHEANEVFTYYSCLAYEEDPNIKKIWERFLEYELGHLSHVVELFECVERRDAAEILPETLPPPIRFESHRDFVRQVLRAEADLSARGMDFVPRDQESEATREYREQLNADGSPSDLVSADHVWQPGTELAPERYGDDDDQPTGPKAA